MVQQEFNTNLEVGITAVRDPVARDRRVVQLDEPLGSESTDESLATGLNIGKKVADAKAGADKIDVLGVHENLPQNLKRKPLL